MVLISESGGLLKRFEKINTGLCFNNTALIRLNLLFILMYDVRASLVLVVVESTSHIDSQESYLGK